MKPILQILPVTIRDLIKSLPRTILGCLEEIRIRQGRPLEVITAEQHWFVDKSCHLSLSHKEGYIPTKDDCMNMLNLVSNRSLYTMDEELRRGYVTVEGGHRIGLVGKVVIEGGRIRHIRDVTGFNLRVAREVKGAGETLIPFLIQGNRAENVLIISAPQCGKTTLIRDLTRLASAGGGLYTSFKVGVVDERSEIAGCVNGVPQHDLGPRTDVLDGCPKAEGMMIMIRSMSPEILVVDEIGRIEDSEAIHEAIYSGVNIFATVHGNSIEDIRKRPILSELIEEGVFTRFVVLSRKSGPGTIDAVYNQSFESISNKEVKFRVVRS